MKYTTYQLFHVSSFLMYMFTLYRGFMLDIPMFRLPKDTFDPGQLRFLTIWNIIIQAVFFFICMLNDWLGTNAVNPSKPPFVRRLKDYLHASICFPVAMFVGITFWSLMAVDRKLVFPKILDNYFPWWLNHLMHTMIMVSITVETILSPRKYPSRAKGFTGHVIFMLIYLIWMHIIYFKCGIWVYPVMEVLSLPLRILFFLVLLVFSLVLYISGEKLDSFIWGNEDAKLQKPSTKSK